MTTWDPPIDTGLNGDRSPEQEIDPFIEDLSDAHSPGVYVFKHSVPSDFAEVERRWSRHYEIDLPAWVREAFESEAVLYVGAAKDVLDRIHTHIDHPNRSTALARVYPIHSVWDVTWMKSAERAFERESGRAIEIRNRYEGIFVRQG